MRGIIEALMGLFGMRKPALQPVPVRTRRRR